MHSSLRLSFLLTKSAFWLCAVAVAILSLLPVAHLPPQALDVWDKAQHSVGFAALALLGLLAYPRHPWHVCLGLLAYGAGIELAQSVTGWRHGDGLDLLADGTGIALGTILHAFVRRGKRVSSRQ